jgi:glycosyltransferase involved in cell wall biosynthesis
MPDPSAATGEIELTILMPCLNEARTLEACIRKSKRFLEESAVSGEVLVADNGSTDGSQEIARRSGARLIEVADPGYGAAVIAGSRQARGKFIIMGDSDESYDFLRLDPFLAGLRGGNDLVMGNRFLGGIRTGAMPWKNRWIGNPGITMVGRLFFGATVGDFNCGLRGFTREAFARMDLRAGGMELASEMVMKATVLGMRVAEVPTVLIPDGRGKPPHMRPWRDGWRNLRIMLVYSPRWLFFYPGLAALLTGSALFFRLLFSSWRIGRIYLDVDTLPFAAAFILIGFQSILFWVYSQVFAATEGFRPNHALPPWLVRSFTLERGLAIGTGFLAFGFAGGLYALVSWAHHSFGLMDVERLLRIVDPSALAMTLGVQIILSSFFLSLLLMRKN